MTVERQPTRADRESTPLVSLADIESAAARISDRVIRTPLLRNDAIDSVVSDAVGGGVNVKLAFKAEHLQVVG